MLNGFPHPLEFKGDQIPVLWPEQQALSRVAKEEGDSISFSGAAPIPIYQKVGIEQAVRLTAENGNHAGAGRCPHVHDRGIDKREILLHARAVVFGDDDVGTLAQPGFDLVLCANDKKLDRVASPAEFEEAYPAAIVAVARRIRRIFSELNGDDGIGTGVSLEEGFRPDSCRPPGLQTGQGPLPLEVIEQQFVEDTVVEVLATCILGKGRPDVVDMKIPGYKFLEAAMGIEEKQRTEMRVDLCRLQDSREMPKEIFRVDLGKRRVGNYGGGRIVHESQIYPVKPCHLPQNQRRLLYHKDVANAEWLTGEVVDDQ